MDLKKLQKKLEGLNQTSNDKSLPYLKIETGDTSLRILPWDRTDEDFFSETALHYIGAEGDKPVHCPKSKGEHCSLCDTYFDVWKRINETGGRDAPGNADLVALAKGIRANRRYYMNVLVRDTNEVKILSMGQKLYTKILSEVLNEDYITEAGETVLDLKNGNDFKLSKETISGYPNYDKSSFRPKKTPLGTDMEISAAMDQCHNIHDEYEEPDKDKVAFYIRELWSTLDSKRSPDRGTGEKMQPDTGGPSYLDHLDI